MTAFALISGTLNNKPVAGVGKNGRKYLRLSIRCDLGLGINRGGAVVFDAEIIETLRHASQGQPVALYGKFDLNEWKRQDGTLVPQASILVSGAVAATMPARRPRKDKPVGSDPQAALSRTAAKVDEFSDEIGF